VGGSYDAFMLRWQQEPPPAPGGYSGTAVPSVSGPSPSSYTQPRNWGSPAVSGRDLIVQRDALRQVSAALARMADQLQTALSYCAGATGTAAGAAGNWHEAQQLAKAVSRAHTGITQFTQELRQAHSDMATRLTVSADRYDAAEQQITSLIYAAADPSATIIGSGGRDTPVQPGYGQNWTPEQRAAYYRIQRLENIPGNSGPDWTATFPITQDAGFSQGGTAGYTWQQVRSMLAATDPGAISAAGAAYGVLASTLTGIASGLAGHGQTLATNWGGSTAVSAVSQVQQLYQTAADLQANTWAAQQALEWYGPVLDTFTSDLPQPASGDPADVTVTDQAAQQRMTALNSHIETAYYQLPGAVNKNLPPPLAGTGSTGTGTGGAGSLAGGYAGTGGGTAPARTNTTATGAPYLGTGLAPAGTTQLAGLSPVGAAAPAPALPGTAAGGTGSGGGFGGIGLLPTAAGAGPAGRFGTAAQGQAADEPVAERAPAERLVPEGAAADAGAADAPYGEFGPAGEPVPAEFGAGVPRAALRDLALTEPGGPASEAGLAGESPLRAGDAAGDGLAAAGEVDAVDAAGLPGMFPMGGASGTGQGRPGQDRQYWASEDEATWGADAMPEGMAGSEAADAGVGWMMPGGTAGRREQRGLGRLAWLGEDEDFWGAGGPVVPPVIGG
jgi:Excreted virulence factor EspC, type VII ESX diderm